MKTLLTILISLISLIGFGQDIDWDSIAEQTAKRLNYLSPFTGDDWYIKEYEDQLEKWRNPFEGIYTMPIYYPPHPPISFESILDLVMSGFLGYYQQYSQECYADSVEVCVFNCYMKYNDKKWEWAEYDCKYYQQYKNIYHCGEPYEKWTHPNEPNFPDFMKWLEGKLE